MADIKYEIIKHIGNLSENARGWTKELNLISWNGATPKYDIRDWAPEHAKMGKGVTLTKEELNALAALIQKTSGLTIPVEENAKLESDIDMEKTPEQSIDEGNRRVTSMKALSIHPVYAMSIVAGQKTVECRTWTTNYRGDILICSTAKKEKGSIPGHALGVVTLDDIVPFQRKHLKGAMMDYYEPGEYAWILTNPRPIKPFPVKGKLSLWTCEHEIEFLPVPKNEKEDEEFGRIYWDPIICR